MSYPQHIPPLKTSSSLSDLRPDPFEQSRKWQQIEHEQQQEQDHQKQQQEEQPQEQEHQQHNLNLAKLLRNFWKK